MKEIVQMKHNTVQNPNWREEIYRRGLALELGTSASKVQRSNHSATQVQKKLVRNQLDGRKVRIFAPDRTCPVFKRKERETGARR